jgi:hypothetical protein
MTANLALSADTKSRAAEEPVSTIINGEIYELYKKGLCNNFYDRTLWVFISEYIRHKHVIE